MDDDESKDELCFWQCCHERCRSGKFGDPSVRRRSRVRRDRTDQAPRAVPSNGQPSIWTIAGSTLTTKAAMELAQKLAAQSVIRLAGLRNIAALPATP
jgi:hypothetical protein